MTLLLRLPANAEAISGLAWGAISNSISPLVHFAVTHDSARDFHRTLPREDRCLLCRATMTTAGDVRRHSVHVVSLFCIGFCTIAPSLFILQVGILERTPCVPKQRLPRRRRTERRNTRLAQCRMHKRTILIRKHRLAQQHVLCSQILTTTRLAFFAFSLLRPVHAKQQQRISHTKECISKNKNKK